MTVAVNDTTERYVIGGVGPYGFSFRIFNDTDLQVYALSTASPPVPTLLTNITHYTVTGANVSSGGSISLTAGAAATYAGFTIDIRSNTPENQPTSIRNLARFLPEIHEDAYDYLSRQIQDVRRMVDAAVRAADYEVALPLTIPALATRIGKFSTYDANGQPGTASGTGNDTALRTDLAAGTAALVDSRAFSYARTPAEIAAAINPGAGLFQYEPGDPRRYTTLANAAAVYVQINSLARYTAWYRGDRAQHQQLTNCIVGLGAYDDSQMTGTLGYRCTAFGVNTLANNKASTLAGGSNTAVGYGSQQNSVDTSGNTGCGTLTLASCTGVNSAHNGAFGNSCLEALVAGAQNNGFSYRAMFQLLRGSNNTAMGDVTLQGLIAGDLNTVYGAQAGFTKPGGNFLCAFGYEACFSETAALISGITKAASAVVTLSTVSGANPYAANDYVTFSDAGGMTQINQLAGIVTAVGGVSGAWTVTVAIDSSTFGVYTAGGYLAPAGNMGFGVKSLFTSQYASGNSVFGYEAISAAIPGLANSAFGFQAGRAIVGGTFNCLFGWRAGLVISSGSVNCLFGHNSGSAITTGSSNVCIGGSAGNAISTGSNNTSIGSGAGTANGTNRQCFGFNAQCIADNTITLGDTNIIQIRAQVTVITAISDERYKTNITDIGKSSGLIRDVRIVRYNWDNSKPIIGPDGDIGIEEDGLDWPSALQVGVLAQNLDAIQEKHGCQWLDLVDKTNPNLWAATPGKLLFPLIASHQELYSAHDSLERAVEAWKSEARTELDQLKARVTELEGRLAA